MDKLLKKKIWTRSRILWISLGIIFIIGFLQKFMFGDRSSRLNVQRDRLKIDTVRRDSFQDYISIIGTVNPIKTIYLDAIEGGRVEEVLIEEGNNVTTGDVILRLSNTNLQLNIMNREAEIAEQMNNLRNTRLLMEQNKLDLKKQLLELDYFIDEQERASKRAQKLYENELISKEEFDEITEKYEYLRSKKVLVLETQKQDSTFRSLQIAQLEASVKRMQDNYSLVRQKLQSLDVTAPVSGELARLTAEIGEAKSAGERLGQINILDSYKLQADIDEYYISRVIRGLQGQFAFDGQTFTVEVTKVYTVVNNGRFTVDMVFVGDIPAKIRIGQTFHVRLELGEPQEATLLARGSFYQSTGGRWVYVVDPSGNFASKRDIKLSRQNPNYFEVLEGLSPGERVIVSSYETYEEIDKLMLK